MLCAALLPLWSGAADGRRTPAQTVDLLHESLRTRNVSVVLSLLARNAKVFENGLIDQSRRDYSASHLAADMTSAGRVSRELIGRHTGGTGAHRWVVSTYRLRPAAPAAGPSRTELETVVMRRIGDSWRIVHIHWSSAGGP